MRKTKQPIVHRAFSNPLTTTVVCGTLFLLCCILSYTGFGQKHRSAVFLGNSYTSSNNLPDLIRQVAESKGHTFSFQQNTPGGYEIAGHLNAPASISLIENTTYDYLVIQGQSAELSMPQMGEGKYLNPDFYRVEYMRQLSKLKDTCNRTLLFMTWGYNTSLQDYLDMQANVSANYEALAHAVDAGVAPVGEAWRYVMENHPDIPLHSADLSHPNQAGSYLAACVFYASMFQEDPTGAWHPAGIAAADALTLQQVAQATVTSDLARWNLRPFSSSCTSAPYPHQNVQWEQLNFATDQEVTHLQFPTDASGYAQCVFPNSLYATHNRGESWDSVSIPSTTGFPFAFHFVTDSIGFFATSDYAIDSNTIDTNTNNPWGIPLAMADHLLFPRIYKTTDAGDSWVELPADSQAIAMRFNGQITPYILYSLHLYFDNESRGSLVYSHTNLKPDSVFTIHTTNGGQQWTAFKNELPEMYPNVFFRSADSIYIGSGEEYNDHLGWWRSTDAGAQWQAADSLAPRCCNSTYKDQRVNMGYPGREGMIAANNLNAPILFRFDDAGQDWDTIGHTSLIGKAQDLEEVVPDKLFGLFENPLNHRIGFSANGGQTWIMDSYHTESLNVLEQTSEYIFAAGRGGLVLRRAISEISALPAYPSEKVALALFPNPAKDALYIRLPADYAELPVRLTMYNSAGIQIKDLVLTQSLTAFNISDLPAGMYFLSGTGFTGGAGKFVIH